jgi:enoyl-CoA hydratase
MNAAYEHLIVALDGPVLRVTINRPDKRNALSRDALAQLRAVFTEYAGDGRVSVAVLRGAGDKCFAAGGDLRDLASVRTEADTAQMSDDARSALDAVRRFPVPVVAALNGDALGGGAELAIACDFRVAAGHARIGFIQGRLNISTAWGGGTDLMGLVGPTRALRLLMRSEVLEGKQALAEGLIDLLVPLRDRLEDAVEIFLEPMRAQVPQVARAFKELAAGARARMSQPELRQIETRNLLATWLHPDHWAAAEKVLTPRSAK